MLSVNYIKFRKWAHYAECHYAECRYAECRYAECCGDPQKAASSDKHSSLLIRAIFDELKKVLSNWKPEFGFLI